MIKKITVKRNLFLKFILTVIFFNQKIQKRKEVIFLVKMKMTSGPFAGEIREIHLGMMDPLEILTAAVRSGWHWEIDYSQASQLEGGLFLRADIVCRAMLAEKEGRPVIFEGREYFDLQKWQKDVLSSGQLIAIGRDDESGFRVEAIDPES